MKNVAYVTPINLNGTVMLFKGLGRTEQASEMIKYYVDNRKEDRKFFDLNGLSPRTGWLLVMFFTWIVL